MTFPAIDGATALTVSSRLARWLLYRHGEEQRLAGLKSWPTPAIVPLTAWIKNAWVQSWPQRYVLSELQSRKLWESVIGADTPAPDLLHLHGAAARAGQAYALVQQYRLTTEPHVFQWTRETESFHRWMRIYESRLREWGAMDPACLMDAVKEAARNGSISIPNSLILAGFDEITPQLQSLLDVLKSAADIRYWPPASQPDEPVHGNVEVREYQDSQEEAVQCARWIRSVSQPGETVGVAAPNVYRSLLQKELAAELAPQSAFPWGGKDLPFNITQGASLAHEPLPQWTLAILSVAGNPIPFETFSAFLGTPFLRGGKSEADARNTLDLKLRHRNTVAVYLHQAERLIDEEHFPKLRPILQSWKELIVNREHQPPSAWAHYFSQFLRRIGWPAGDGAWTDKMHQTYEAWTQCLDAFASLDRVMGNLTRRSAADTLSRITEEKLFQLKTDDQPVQVVGLEESAGMQFDHLWVAGCGADTLPAVPSPNPFLPLNLQKNLPRSSSDWELQFAERAVSRLLRSSPHIVFSFPAWDQEKELRMSPLLNALPKPEPVPNIAGSHRILDLLQPPADLEHWQDPPALPVTADERGELKQDVSHQGYGVLKNQADCPFRAFVHYRLHTRKFPIPEMDSDGAEAAQRGKHVHKALEIFWNLVKNRSTLQRLQTGGGLDAAIRDCAMQAMAKTYGGRDASAQQHFIKLELDRLVSLLQSWLAIELLRPDFEVRHREESGSVKIGGLELGIRIDRMDQVEGGKLILIDYKTGKVSPNDWFQERIQEPQLPLYALKFSPNAIAYAVIKKEQKEMSWKTVAEEPTVMKGIKTIDFSRETGCSDWQELMEYWKKNLTALAQEFLAGKLIVDPFKGDNTCRNCGLETLCRVGETGGDILDTEEPE